MAKPGKIRRVVPVFIILFLAPIIVILIFKFGKNTYKELPYYGAMVGISPNGDTLRHTIQNFRFIDQNGTPFGSDSLKGKIYIASFFYTNSPDTCLRITRNLAGVQERFRNDKDFRAILISTDPARDNPAALAAYAKKTHLESYQWHLLTTPDDSVMNIMGDNGYLLKRTDLLNDDAAHFHSDIFVLVDKEGHIRGKYNGMDENEAQRLVEDAHTLFVLYTRKNTK